MRNLFNLDSPIMATLSRITDLVLLNLLFIICCIPIITIGPSLCALYAVTLKMVRGEESYIFSGFFAAFKSNFKTSFFTWLIILAAGMFLFVDYRIASSSTNAFLFMLSYFFISILFLLFIVITYIFPYIAWFKDTFRQNFKNAFLLSAFGLPYTILMVIIYIACIFLTLFFLQWSIPFMILLGFSSIALLNSFFFRRIFDKLTAKKDQAQEEE